MSRASRWDSSAREALDKQRVQLGLYLLYMQKALKTTQHGPWLLTFSTEGISLPNLSTEGQIAAPQADVRVFRVRKRTFGHPRVGSGLDPVASRGGLWWVPKPPNENVELK